ncbi:MAG: hypothetical protein ACI4QC_05315 [Thermoguttaceae bacterium]
MSLRISCEIIGIDWANALECQPARTLEGDLAAARRDCDRVTFFCVALSVRERRANHAQTVGTTVSFEC